MRILYRSAASRNGSQKLIIDGLVRKGVVDGGVILDYSNGMDCYTDDFFLIPSNKCFHDQYDEICDMNEIPEPEPELLEKMEAYKATCLHIAGLRPHDLYVGDYYTLERMYMRAVRFWGFILDKYEIDFGFFPVIPHVLYEYTLYALMKCKGLPTLIVHSTHIPGIACVGTGIENIGYSCNKAYIDGISNKNTKLQKVLDEYASSISEKNVNLYPESLKKEAKKKDIQMFHGRFPKLAESSMKTVLRDIRDKKNLRDDIYILRQDQIARDFAAGTEYYEKKIAQGVPNGRFICFFLQQTPEATTLPAAGIYANQLLSIRLLAEILKIGGGGIKVVVKEHWNQRFRPRSFYEELISIPNVFPVSMYIESAELMKQSIAVATQTGSVISESIKRGKPVLAFSSGWWNEVEGVYVVRSKMNLEKAVVEISKANCPKGDFERYLASHGATCIRWKLDYDENVAFSDEEIAEDAVDLIEQYVVSGMRKDFFYLRKECRE